MSWVGMPQTRKTWSIANQRVSGSTGTGRAIDAGAVAGTDTVACASGITTGASSTRPV